MKMTNKFPSNWKELQILVAKYFNEAGYIAETPYEIELVRGKKEVDVYVKAPNELGKEIIIECKYWDTNIPQNEIHALRTAVNDAGVSLGIIISKVGFQEGAFNSVTKSNVELKTWNEFLEMIFDKWLLEQMKFLKRKRAPWERNFEHVERLYELPSDVRRVIYTTNMIEGYHSSLRRVTKVINIFSIFLLTSYS